MSKDEKCIPVKEIGGNVMRKVPVHYLRPGMKIGSSVFSSEGILLLRSGTFLTKNTVNRLKLMDIPAVFIDDGFIKDVEVVDVISDETRNDAIKKVRNIFGQVEIAKKAQRLCLVIDESKITDVVEKILENLLLRNDVLVSLSDIRTFDDYTYGHSVNVCTLALLTGNALKLSHNSLVQLGTGAILHDLGKILTPKDILNKPGALSEEEFNTIKRHCEDGYMLLREKGKVGSLAASVVREHHERIDGSGYPRGLKGDKIHILSKIVGLVDVYDALTADRVYRKGYMPHEAYEMLAAAVDISFDFQVVKAFLDNIAMYPIGSFVELDTGQVGAVVKAIKGLTHRPVIRVFFEDKSIPVVKPYEVDLSTKLNVMINRVLDFLEVDKLSLKLKQYHEG
ncbi:HD-GYP domain-containing protein [Desulfitibacter alkalitolerans]|uniref:HD-GYP domain-containing protein n=1 Tax=Desulfitibacter alkalitolerans TaxID=264641 RepID=UPI0009FDBAAD|nr:HD-GYP domain-containing protein [Desulfitibacter alkalitolerans]